MDDIDRKLLTLLMEEGRSTWVDLADAVGLSPPSVTERVRKLEHKGIIRGYVAVVNPAAVEQRLLALVYVSLASTRDHDPFVEAVRRLPQVQECHIIAGDFDYVLKVRCSDGETLADLLRDEIRALPGVAATSTRITLQTMKETTALPLP